ncbi:phospholipase D-like domain-containing protein [Streptomyces hebeiensis]
MYRRRHRQHHGRPNGHQQEQHHQHEQHHQRQDHHEPQDQHRQNARQQNRRQRRRGRGAWATALGIGLLAVGVPGPAAATEATETTDVMRAAAVTPGAIFNDPAGTATAQNRIRDHVISLIQGAPAGSSITLSLYTFTDNDVRTALVAANDRGVGVRAILDHKSRESRTPGGEYENLAAKLGTDRTKKSWVMTCPQTRSCIGNRTIGQAAINHNKFFLFSSTGGADDVVVQTSANMTGVQRTDLFNNAVTLVDSGLYANYLAYFADQEKYGTSGDGLASYYKTPSSPTDAAYKTYFFPRQESSGKAYNTDPATDTVKLILDNVTCSSSQPTEVRMAANLFYRDHIATKLVAMADAGCKVYLAADGNPNGGREGVPSMGRTVESIVSGKLTQRVACWENPPAGRTANIGLHSKYLLVKGVYAGVANEKIVFTGSHNYSWQALRSNDETLLKINDDAVHDQFKADHDHLMDYCAGS